MSSILNKDTFDISATAGSTSLGTAMSIITNGVLLDSREDFVNISLSIKISLESVDVTTAST